MANLELEGIIMEMGEDKEKGKEMKFYLENTDMLVKRMVSATLDVEPHLPELETSRVQNENKDIYFAKTSGKRKHDDDGAWWLSGLSTSGRRPPWPTSRPTLRRRTF